MSESDNLVDDESIDVDNFGCSSAGSHFSILSNCSVVLRGSSYLETLKDAIEKGFKIVPKPDYEVGSYKLFNDIINQKIDSVFSAAKIAFTKGSFKKCLSHLSKAFYFDPDNVRYYLLGADTYLALKDYKSAILYYKRVCIIEPDNEKHYTKLSDIYYLYGESFFDKESFLDAFENYTLALEIKPDISLYHEKSIMCLASLNRHKECLNFINKRLTVDATNVKLLLFRANLHLMFSNSTLAYCDIKEVLSIDPANAEANKLYRDLETSANSLKEKAEELNLNCKLTEAIMKISQAISTNPSVTEYHVMRASMHRKNGDFNASVDDLILAMDELNHDSTNPVFIDALKQLLLTFNDFAVECFQKGFYEEAIILLEKAIKGEKENKALYSNRGDCFLKLEHLQFALLDYQQALELDSSDESILLRVSITYNELGLIEYDARKYVEAEEFFCSAIYHNPTVAVYYTSRAKSRYMIEKLTEAKVDTISALYFDASNKEALSMCSRLFPGKSAQDALEGEFGSLVVQALESELKNLDAGNERKAKCNLKKTSPLPRIHARSSVNLKLQECMDDKQFCFNILEEKKKLNDLVESVVQSRLDLTYSGPSVHHVTKSTSARKSARFKLN